MAGKVLIVEDDGDLREALSQILQDEGYGVDEAMHGLQALDRLRDGSGLPCVILLDLTMPIMNGWQFRSEQKEDPDLRRIPVVVLSAGADLAEEVSALGVQEYLRKPVQLSHLLQTIQRFCPETVSA
jgi:CheY-like chemotaxis protein